MTMIQLRTLIDCAPILKLGDRAMCETLMTSIKMDFGHMANARTRDDTLYLMREVNRKKDDITNIIKGA